MEVEAGAVLVLVKAGAEADARAAAGWTPLMLAAAAAHQHGTPSLPPCYLLSSASARCVGWMQRSAEERRRACSRHCESICTASTHPCKIAMQPQLDPRQVQQLGTRDLDIHPPGRSALSRMNNI
eukprot:21403-Rhodomonas_salina.1